MTKFCQSHTYRPVGGDTSNVGHFVPLAYTDHAGPEITAESAVALRT